LTVVDNQRAGVTTAQWPQIVPQSLHKQYFNIGSIAVERLACRAQRGQTSTSERRALDCNTKVERNAAELAARWTMTVGQLDEASISDDTERWMDSQSVSQAH